MPSIILLTNFALHNNLHRTRSYYLDSRQAAAQPDEDAAAAAAPAKAPARRVDAAELLREAEEAAGDAGMELLDSRGLKRLTLALERKVGADCGCWLWVLLEAGKRGRRRALAASGRPQLDPQACSCRQACCNLMLGNHPPCAAP